MTLAVSASDAPPVVLTDNCGMAARQLPPNWAEWTVHRKIGWNIRQLREKNGWNQTQLAEKFGRATPATISYIESGTRKVSLEDLEILAGIFNVSVKKLLQQVWF